MVTTNHTTDKRGDDRDLAHELKYFNGETRSAARVLTFHISPRASQTSIQPASLQIRTHSGQEGASKEEGNATVPGSVKSDALGRVKITLLELIYMTHFGFVASASFKAATMLDHQCHLMLFLREDESIPARLLGIHVFPIGDQNLLAA